MTFLKTILVTAILFMSAGQALALYKCEDPQGGISYSDKPCVQKEQSRALQGVVATRKNTGPGEETCRKVQEFGTEVAKLMRKNISSSDVSNHIGGDGAINAVVFEVINYVYSFQSSPRVPPGQIGGLSYNKCMGGGFSFPEGMARSGESSGTGFIVDNSGHVLTNYHVVEKCSKLVIASGKENHPAELVATNPDWDLALVKAVLPDGRPVSFRGGNAPALGESVMVAGYPLKGILADDLQVTTGSISALAGIRNDNRMLQITAPVQPGNSGGPLFDSAGSVIGVVVAKLNAMKIAEQTGDIPQNINFAINGDLAKRFLGSHRITFRTSHLTDTINTAEIAAYARLSVVPVICQ